MEATQSLKRRLSEDEHENTKRKVFRDGREFELIDFSDEILLLILKNLDSYALVNVAKTCHRMREVAGDKTLWTDVDLTAQPLSGKEIGEIIFKDVCCYTEIRELRLRGLVSQHPQDVWKNQTVTLNFLERLDARCPNLRSISIVEACFDISQVMALGFPKRLTEFKVDRCEVIKTAKKDEVYKSFFHGIQGYMANLERLWVENCNWFDTHDLIAFSKLPNLKFLSLRGCNTFKECVPYGSIATRFGFRALEILDVRNTPVTDSDIQCFNMTRSLKELRLQCPEKRDTPDAEQSPVVDPAEAGPSTTPVERQVINLHIRRVNEPAPSAEHQNQEQQNPAPAEDVQVQPENENGAEFEAGNNVRINIRNQNVQGRNVIHIVVRNNHQCRGPGGNNHDEAGPSGEPPQQQAQPAAAPGPAAAAAAAPENPAPAAEEGSAQNYIIVHGLPNAQGLDPPGILQFIQFERTFPINLNVHPATLITDRGICSFGQSRGNHQQGVIWIRMENRSPTTSLERITVRDYKLVTDNSLLHLSTCAPNLKFLDVVGTEVTKDGIEKFKLVKPDCMVVSDFGDFE